MSALCKMTAKCRRRQCISMFFFSIYTHILSNDRLIPNGRIGCFQSGDQVLYSIVQHQIGFTLCPLRDLHIISGGNATSHIVGFDPHKSSVLDYGLTPDITVSTYIYLSIYMCCIYIYVCCADMYTYGICKYAFMYTLYWYNITYCSCHAFTRWLPINIAVAIIPFSAHPAIYTGWLANCPFSANEFFCFLTPESVMARPYICPNSA